MKQRMGAALLAVGLVSLTGRTAAATTEPPPATEWADSTPADTVTLTSIQEIYDHCAERARVEFEIMFAAEPGMFPVDESIESAMRFYTTDGEAISVDGAFRESEYDFGTMDADYIDAAAACILDVTDPPQRVTEHITSTRALDGMQTDTWDEFEARWTYHPDDGLNLTVWSESGGIELVASVVEAPSVQSTPPSSSTATTLPAIDPTVADALKSLGIYDPASAEMVTTWCRGGTAIGLSLADAIADPTMRAFLEAACPAAVDAASQSS